MTIPPGQYVPPFPRQPDPVQQAPVQQPAQAAPPQQQAAPQPWAPPVQPYGTQPPVQPHGTQPPVQPQAFQHPAPNASFVPQLPVQPQFQPAQQFPVPQRPPVSQQFPTQQQPGYPQLPQHHGPGQFGQAPLPAGRPPKKKRTGVIVAIAVGIPAFLIAIGIAAVLVVTSTPGGLAAFGLGSVRMDSRPGYDPAVETAANNVTIITNDHDDLLPGKYNYDQTMIERAQELSDAFSVDAEGSPDDMDKKIEQLLDASNAHKKAYLADEPIDTEYAAERGFSPYGAKLVPDWDAAEEKAAALTPYLDANGTYMAWTDEIVAIFGMTYYAYPEGWPETPCTGPAPEGVDRPAGIYCSLEPDKINLLVDGNAETDPYFVSTVLHEVSHGAIDRKCGSPDVSTESGISTEAVTESYTSLRFNLADSEYATGAYVQSERTKALAAAIINDDRCWI